MSSVSYQNVRLARGRHESPDHGACVMELVSMLAREPFSDRPKTACPVIGAFLRSYNDISPPSRRQDLLACASQVVGSRRPELERSRVRHCVRVALALHARRSRWRRIAEGGSRASLRRMADAPIDSLSLDELGYRLARLIRHAPDGRRRALELVDELVTMGQPTAPERQAIAIAR
jgi:hypothetical protein